MGSIIRGLAPRALVALLGIATFGQAQGPDPFKEAMIKALTGVQPDAPQKLEPGQRGDWSKAASLVVALLEQQAALKTETKGTEASKDAEARKKAMQHLADVLIGGERSAEARAKLFENKEVAAAAIEHLGKQLVNQRQQLIAMLIMQASQTGARFAGQYAAIKKLGPNIEATLLDLIETQPQGVTDNMRAAMLLAIRDVGHNLDEAMLKRVAALADDTFEDEGVQANAGYLLYACGDKSRVEKRIESLRAAAEKGKDLQAFHALAEVYWQVGEHDKAIGTYKTAIEAAPADMPKNELATLHYNMACSQALAGKVDDAFATLDKALPMMDATNRSNLLRNDGDLTNLRKDERFAQLVEKFGKPAEKPAKAEKPEDKAKTGGTHDR